MEADTAEYFREFGRVMEVVPVTLAENSGPNVIRVVTELRGRHGRGQRSTRVDPDLFDMTAVNRNETQCIAYSSPSPGYARH